MKISFEVPDERIIGDPKLESLARYMRSDADKQWRYVKGFVGHIGSSGELRDLEIKIEE